MRAEAQRAQRKENGGEAANLIPFFSASLRLRVNQISATSASLRESSFFLPMTPEQ